MVESKDTKKDVTKEDKVSKKEDAKNTGKSSKTNVVKSKAKVSKKSKSKLKMLNNLSLIAPVATEKAVLMIDTQNTLVFYVDRNARKNKIKKDVEELLNVKVDNVRTTITMSGKKKAYVKINEDYMASDLAGKLGMM